MNFRATQNCICSPLTAKKKKTLWNVSEALSPPIGYVDSGYFEVIQKNRCSPHSLKRGANGINDIGHHNKFTAQNLVYQLVVKSETFSRISGRID